MPRFSQRIWLGIEKVLGTNVQPSLRRRYEDQFSDLELELILKELPDYIAQFPDSSNSPSMIFTLGGMIRAGTWVGEPVAPPLKASVAVDKGALVSQPWVTDPLVLEMPILIQALVAGRLQGTAICLDYAIAGALAVAAATVGNRVRFSTWGDSYHFPNIYLLLVGETSTSYKSSVGKWVKSMLTDVDPSALAADEGSVEALIKDLSERPSRLWIQDEFAGLLSSMKTRDYMKPARELLLSLYDHSGIYRRHLSRAQFQCQDPALSLLTTIQPEVMGEEMFGGRNIDSGFVNRLLMVPGEGGAYWPEIDDYSIYRGRILARLREMWNQPRVTATMGRESLELAGQWVGKEEASFGPYGKWVAARANIQALKIATLFEASETWPGGKRISKDWMFVALSLLERWYKKSCAVIEEVHIKQPGERDRRDFFRLACAHSHNGIGPQSLGRLAAEAQISSRKSDEYMRDLVDRGWVSADDEAKLVCTKRSPICETK